MGEVGGHPVWVRGDPKEQRLIDPLLVRAVPHVDQGVGHGDDSIAV